MLAEHAKREQRLKFAWSDGELSAHARGGIGNRRGIARARAFLEHPRGELRQPHLLTFVDPARPKAQRDADLGHLAIRQQRDPHSVSQLIFLGRGKREGRGGADGRLGRDDCLGGNGGDRQCHGGDNSGNERERAKDHGRHSEAAGAVTGAEAGAGSINRIERLVLRRYSRAVWRTRSGVTAANPSSILFTAAGSLSNRA